MTNKWWVYECTMNRMDLFKSTPVEMLERKEDFPHLLPLKEGGEGNPIFSSLFTPTQSWKGPINVEFHRGWNGMFCSFLRWCWRELCSIALHFVHCFGKSPQGTGKLISGSEKKQSAKFSLHSTCQHYRRNEWKIPLHPQWYCTLIGMLHGFINVKNEENCANEGISLTSFL